MVSGECYCVSHTLALFFFSDVHCVSVHVCLGSKLQLLFVVMIINVWLGTEERAAHCSHHVFFAW